MSDYHKPVLLQSCLDYLNVRPGGVYVDGTLGGGGHSEAILKSEAEPRVFAFDMDGDAIREASARLAEFSKRLVITQDNFKNFPAALPERGPERFLGLLLDLGVSSFQLDRSEKGFSYRTDVPLKMAMSDSAAHTADEVVNGYAEEKLAKIFFEYGEERQSRRIARAIVKTRGVEPLKSTGQLVKVIESVIPPFHAKKTLSRVFQAIRIEVNDELENLRETLLKAVDLLAPTGRIVVISYHSLEDRIVKEFFREEASDEIKNFDYPELSKPKVRRLKLITKKPVLPDDNEIAVNSRARSAKLRVAEKI